jgi:FkbM family methyltransferase
MTSDETKTPSVTHVKIDAGVLGVRDFVVPDNENPKQVMTEVLGGLSYPVIDFLQSEVTKVFDIGANIGSSAVYFNIVYPKAQVFAFEPGTVAFSFLRANVDGLERVSIFKAGLYDRDKTETLKVWGAAGEMSSVLAVPNLEGTDTEEIELIDALRAVSENIVPSDRVVLKIDTEGCEVPILNRLSPLMHQVAVAYLEYHSEDDRRTIDAFMAEHGMMLNNAKAGFCHRGDVTYVSERILAEKSRYYNHALPRPR